MAPKVAFLAVRCVQLISENPRADGEGMMGGVFSGQRASKKRVVESCTTLDTADLNRWGPLKAGASRVGSLEWRRGGEKEPSASVGYTLDVQGGAGTLRLHYHVGQPAQRCDYAVRLVATPCHLGGVRWWFVCPLVKGGLACGRRVRKLYLCGKYFGCRHCHGLTYRSCQESDSRVYAAVRGGLDLSRLGRVEGMSVQQLGFALKVLSFEQKRLDRPGRGLERPARSRRGRKAPGCGPTV